MNSDEAEMPQGQDRKTLERCGDEPQRGFVCILERGHEGDHACRTEEGFARLSWRRRQ
jgi:hypothetical protein